MEALARSDVMVRPSSTALDPSPLLGRWVNTNPHSRGAVEVAIALDGGPLKIRAFSGGSPLCAWGETKVDFICGPDMRAQKGTCFSARYDFGGFQTEIQGNMNLGLLVVASFNRIGGAGYDYFVREFYSHVDSGTTPPSTPWTPATGRVGGDDSVEQKRTAPGQPFDCSELVGRWLNTNPEPKDIARVQIDSDGGNGVLVKVIGLNVRPGAWEPLPATLFSLGAGSSVAKAFRARYHADGVTVNLQVNNNRGVLVVASFTEFNDGSGRSNYFQREFYYRG